jgi:hypothetical protein
MDAVSIVDGIPQNSKYVFYFDCQSFMIGFVF